MAESGPSDGAGAGTMFQLEVNTVAGTCLAAIPGARGSWQLGYVLDRLPDVPPGHRYQLLNGEAVLAPGTAIAQWARPVDGRACVTAVVVAVPTQKEQRRLNLALIEAAGELNVEQVRELLFLGADATTALHKVVDRHWPSGPGDGREEQEQKKEKEGRLQAVLGALLSARADVDAAQEKVQLGGWSVTYALHFAVKYGSLGLVRMLLDARASIDAVAKQPFGQVHGRGHGMEVNCEYTALHAATQASNLPIVALLLERGANVNAVKRKADQEEGFRNLAVYETALHIAVAGGHLALVALLTQAGADTSIARSRGGKDTPLEELCASHPGTWGALNAESSAALLAGGAVGAEVEAALAAIAARRAAA